MSSIFVCGVINWDTLLFVKDLPAPGEEVKVNRAISVPGGKGGNTAVAAARLLDRSSPTNTRVGIIAMLGSDDIAQKQLRILGEEGVDTSCIIQYHGINSGQAFVLIDKNGQDMIMTYSVANEMMMAEKMKIVVNEIINFALGKSEMMIIIDPPLETAANLSKQCKDGGKPVIVSPALLTSYGFSALRRYLNNADYVILNQQEAKSLMSIDDSMTACSKLSDALGGKKVITTLGSKGCIFCSWGKKTIIPTMDLSKFNLKVKSSAGAGDSFVGAFGAFKLEGLDDFESIILANIAAALKTTREEIRGTPTRNELYIYANKNYINSLRNQIRFIS